MEEDASGAGRFVPAMLRPNVVIQAGGDVARAAELHNEAHRYCYIASSLHFQVECQPVIAPGTGP